jgi:DnaJ-class molecular chaperone
MDLYKCLQVEKGAGPDEIRKAYLKLSKKNHPDRGGDPEEFKKIQKAYDVLSDAQSRDFYDMTGSIPGEQDSGPSAGPGAGPGGFPFDMGNIFNMFASGMRGQAPGAQQQQKMPKGPTKVQEIGLTLQQFYTGHKLDMKFERQKFCTDCAGSGAKRKDTCDGCGGSGTQMNTMMMGAMMMTMNGPCKKCSGRGTITHDKCGGCDGKGLVNDNRQIAIMIEPGMAAGDVLVFENGCSDDPIFEKPGDVRIVLQEAEEGRAGWRRAGDNLEYDMELSVGEGLVGTTKRLEGHPRLPDGMYITVPAATVAGDVLVLKGEGMPVRGGGGRRGDARLTVRVVPAAGERERIITGGAALRELLGVISTVEGKDAIAAARV